MIQSRALRTIAKEGRDSRSTNEELHIRYNIEPINQRIFNLSSRIWNKFIEQEPEILDLSEQLENYPGREHKWWPRTYTTIINDLPEPVYV